MSTPASGSHSAGGTPPIDPHHLDNKERAAGAPASSSTVAGHTYTERSSETSTTSHTPGSSDRVPKTLFTLAGVEVKDVNQSELISKNANAIFKELTAQEKTTEGMKDAVVKTVENINVFTSTLKNSRQSIKSSFYRFLNYIVAATAYIVSSSLWNQLKKDDIEFKNKLDVIQSLIDQLTKKVHDLMEMEVLLKENPKLMSEIIDNANINQLLFILRMKERDPVLNELFEKNGITLSFQNLYERVTKRMDQDPSLTDTSRIKELYKLDKELTHEEMKKLGEERKKLVKERQKLDEERKQLAANQIIESLKNNPSRIPEIIHSCSISQLVSIIRVQENDPILEKLLLDKGIYLSFLTLCERVRTDPSLIGELFESVQDEELPTLLSFNEGSPEWMMSILSDDKAYGRIRDFFNSAVEDSTTPLATMAESFVLRGEDAYRHFTTLLSSDRSKDAMWVQVLSDVDEHGNVKRRAVATPTSETIKRQMDYSDENTRVIASSSQGLIDIARANMTFQTKERNHYAISPGDHASAFNALSEVVSSVQKLTAKEEAAMKRGRIDLRRWNLLNNLFILFNQTHVSDIGKYLSIRFPNTRYHVPPMRPTKWFVAFDNHQVRTQMNAIFSIMDLKNPSAPLRYVLCRIEQTIPNDALSENSDRFAGGLPDEFRNATYSIHVSEVSDDLEEVQKLRAEHANAFFGQDYAKLEVELETSSKAAEAEAKTKAAAAAKAKEDSSSAP